MLKIGRFHYSNIPPTLLCSALLFLPYCHLAVLPLKALNTTNITMDRFKETPDSDSRPQYCDLEEQKISHQHPLESSSLTRTSLPPVVDRRSKLRVFFEDISVAVALLSYAALIAEAIAAWKGLPESTLRLLQSLRACTCTWFIAIVVKMRFNEEFLPDVRAREENTLMVFWSKLVATFFGLGTMVFCTTVYKYALHDTSDGRPQGEFDQLR